MSQLGDHMAALRILALTLQDMDAAESYCTQHMGPPGYLTLLGMLLHPGPGQEPLFVEACRLLAAQGTPKALCKALCNMHGTPCVQTDGKDTP